MVEVRKEGVLLRPTALKFECEGVLNPGVILDNGTIHVFYRAVGKGNFSTIGYCQLNTPITVSRRNAAPLLIPEFPYESQGIEDPRIVRIDGLFYLTYTAYDGVRAMGALATSTDLQSFDKYGIIVPEITHGRFHELVHNTGEVEEKYLTCVAGGCMPERRDEHAIVWDKNVIFFPRRIGGKLHFLHRIKPEIQLVAVTDLAELTPEFWLNYFNNFKDNIVLSPKYGQEISYIGGGCPPIETQVGWLLIYHGVCKSGADNVYSACAALLDLDDPRKEIARLPFPLFEPEEEWEKNGAVNNVCFPTGAVVVDKRLFIYYGAADEQVACASVLLADLLSELLLNTK